MLVIEPTGSACGALVKGIDLNKPIPPTLMEKLVWALYQHRCLVIKNQKLTKESYYRFASQWGEAYPTCIRLFKNAGLSRNDGYRQHRRERQR